MLPLSTEQILALSPDDASRKAGQGLAAASKWVSAGSNERAVWGECQGSGSKPYQTIADMVALAFKCSCPSRKFPCKHGIGLLLYCLKDEARFAAADEPAWVADWLNKREQKAAPAAGKQEAKPADAATQAKRSAAREEKVTAGIEELLLWMKDALRTGIIQLPEKGARYFEEMAKRLVDAQAPGLARMVRETGDINFFKEDWQTAVLDSFARMYLTASGFQHAMADDAALAHDLRSSIGFPQGAELLEGQPAIKDIWVVIGSRSEQEGALTVERHWLAGSEGHTALFLQFVPYGARPGVNLYPGQCFEGEVIYYPSAAPLRAAIRAQAVSNMPAALSYLEGWDDVVRKEAEALSRNLLVRELPHLVMALRPVKEGDAGWMIEDGSGKRMRLHPGFKDIWKWMALSGGEFLRTAVLGAEHTYAPLGVWQDNTYVSLS